MKGNDMTDQGENIQPQDEQEPKPAGKITNALWFCLGFVAVSLLVVIVVYFRPRYQHACAPPSCKANTWAIGNAISLYMYGKNKGFPPDLFALLEEGQPTSLFVCPHSDDPNDYVLKIERSAFEQHCDYIYLAGLDGNSPATLPIVFDLSRNHGQEFANILHGDVSVDKLETRQLYGLVQRSNDYLAGKRRGVK